MTTPTPTPIIPDTTTVVSFRCPCTPIHAFISDCHHYQNSPTQETLRFQQQALRVQDTQAKEEYLIEQFTCVFDVLDQKYHELEKKLIEEMKEKEEGNETNVFEERVLRAVLAHVREVMGMNELVLEEARRELWDGFEFEGMGGGEGGLVEDVAGLNLKEMEKGGAGDEGGEDKDKGNRVEEVKWEEVHEQYFDPKFC